jgi:thiosulfate dehydrogenase
MRDFFLGLAVGAVLPILAVIGYLKLGLAEMRVDLKAPSWETRLMNAAVHASVRRYAPELTNPVRPTDENLIAGGKAYMDGCAGCHGMPGKPQSGSADALYPPVPQFAQVGTEYSESEIFWIVKHGIRRSGMFANGKWLSDEQIWTLANYVKRINNLPPAVRSALEVKKPGQDP